MNRQTHGLCCAVLLIIGLACAGCGGGGGGTVALAVSPSTASLAPSAGQSFSLNLSGSPIAATWSVQEGAAGGSIDANGNYVASNTAGTYHVIGTSVADPAQTAAARVTVHVVVGIDPLTRVVTLTDTIPFSAVVTGSINQSVTWSIQEGSAGGSVTNAGIYTAPKAPGKFHVIARSLLDPAQSATATITVQAGDAYGNIQ